ncbi:methyl-accepting chemotaxis protein [Tissierella sp. MB52-C2]|uniref:methyl-accepting chemotaxis protein n=1 Tax=Tissierella sp. MB52-C2 TaxID=3070999 RepID=UPI00280A9E0E|nr:methyl-accepting chemotaxis protein [Tissierella sp. MB52-C2]WMM24223.1 methyl-accepting chemotaxis protein [Tissierella sp. MB52-C2]
MKKLKIKVPNLKKFKSSKLKNEKSKSVRTIKFKLIVVPLVFLFTTILVIELSTSYLFKKNILNAKKNNGFQLADQVINRMNDNESSITTITEVLENNMKATANSVIKYQDSLSNEVLDNIKDSSIIDNIYWYNENMEMIYSTVREDIGWRVPPNHPLDTFMKSTEIQMIEEIRQDAASENGSYYKFGAVKGKNGEFVQVAISANSIHDLTEKFEYQKLVNDLSKSADIAYAGFIDPNNKIIAHSNNEKIGTEISDANIIEAISERKGYSSIINNGEEVYEFVVPANINGRFLGALNIALSMEDTNAAINRNMIIVFIIGLTSFIILGTILFITSRTIASSLNIAKNHLNVMASGDFTHILSHKFLSQRDEFGEISNSLGNLQSFIKKIIGDMYGASSDLKLASEKLASTSAQTTMVSQEIANTVQEIAHGAYDQARDTEKGAMTINVLGELIEKNQQYVEELNKTTDEVRALKDEGSEIVKELVEKTKINQDSVEEINRIILNTNNSTEKIHKASYMIQNIARETNLLALNAAIEAARAGEHGRGFAVVADEIRKLAENSNEFTKEIVNIIEDLTQETEYAVNNIEKVREATELQRVSVENTNDKFEGIADAIEKIGMAIEYVISSGDEMNSKKEDIINIIENLSAISEENAAGTQETSASVEEQISAMAEIELASKDLLNLSEEMYKEISKFKY